MATAAWLLWLLLVAVLDFRQRRVPNGVVLCGAAIALLTLAWGLQPFQLAWPQALAGAALGSGFLLIFYATKLMGAGDVKFAGALGLWVGFEPLLPIWLIASLLAGLHAVLWLVLQRWPVWPGLALALSGSAIGEAGKLRGGRHIPFAAYLAIASLGWMASVR